MPSCLFAFGFAPLRSRNFTVSVWPFFASVDFSRRWTLYRAGRRKPTFTSVERWKCVQLANSFSQDCITSDLVKTYINCSGLGAGHKPKVAYNLLVLTLSVSEFLLGLSHLLKTACELSFLAPHSRLSWLRHELSVWIGSAKGRGFER